MIGPDLARDGDGPPRAAGRPPHATARRRRSRRARRRRARPPSPAAGSRRCARRAADRRRATRASGSATSRACRSGTSGRAARPSVANASRTLPLARYASARPRDNEIALRCGSAPSARPCRPAGRRSPSCNPQTTYSACAASVSPLSSLSRTVAHDGWRLKPSVRPCRSPRFRALRDDQRGRVAQRDEPEAKMRAFRRGGRVSMAVAV